MLRESPVALPARPQSRWPTYALGRLHRVGRDQTDSALSSEGLSLRTFIVLEAVGESPGLSQQQLADLVGIDRSDVVKLIDQLEALAMVTRQRDPADRRRHVLALTPHGDTTCTRAKRLAQQVTDQVLSRLTVDERHTLHRLTLRALGEPADGANH